MAARFLPEIWLNDERGNSWSVEGLRQRQEILLALVGDESHADSLELLRALAREARSVGLSGAAAAVLAAPGSWERVRELELTIPMLEDPDSTAQRAVARAADLPADAVALVAADRYGEVQFAKPLAGGDANRLVRDALDQIDYVQMQCPE